MYAHQVIESLKGNPTYDPKEIARFCRVIAAAQKFHFESAESIGKAFNRGKEEIKLFCGILRRNITPPYATTWFDFKYDVPNKIDSSTRVGFLLLHLGMSDPDYFTVYLFEYVENSFWCIWPIAWKVDLNPEETTTESRFLENLYGEENKTPIDRQFHRVVSQSAIDRYFWLVNFSLVLLNCRNIDTVNVYPPPKLQRKREKRGKQPLFTYKTLIIKPVGKRQESIPKHLWENRIHLARGHPKTYTEDKPLFGKHTGTFWWQPHIRGRNKTGVVMKDYKVEQSA